MEGASRSPEEPAKCSKEIPVGILRLDFGKPRRLSTEFKILTQGEPTSPQPSIDRLSVTFAEDSVKSDSSTRNFNPSSGKMDKVHFPHGTDEEDSDAEDYSASVNAIIQRRASTRRSKRRNSRRASSPFSPDILPGTENGRRRSSVFTTSSGDTAITVDENLANEVTQEEIFENIKLHKEVLSNVKMQPWNMRKKMKLVLQAKAYVKKHEGALQERLAQSHSTRDMLARWNIYLIKRWQKWKREMLNLSMWFIPWELRIKEIESHFGSVVASYFIFLRWLFWVNIVIGAVIVSFVAIPELLTADPREAGARRKYTLPEEKYNATNFLTLWDFEGVFKYSPLFYGWYTNSESKLRGYRLPFAYFVTGLMVYAYSFFATLRKMAENSRMSKLSEKDDECIFSWKLFTAWDYMIGNAETAHNRVASIVMGFKEALLEEAEKKKQKRDWKIIGFRVLVNTVVVGLLSFSAFAVIMVVKRSTEPEANSTVWRKNEITIVMSLITLFFPMLFEVLGFMEQYHPRKQLRLQLARIMVLNLLNLYSLIFALFDKITDMTTELQDYKNLTSSNLLTSTTSSLQSSTGAQKCYEVCSEAQLPSNLISALAQNISLAAYPKLVQIFTEPSTASLEDSYNSTATVLDFAANSTSAANLTDFILEDFTDGLTDYLLSILSPFVYTNSTGNDTDIGYSNVTYVNSTDLTDINATDLTYINNTDLTYISTTEITNNLTDFSFFKSTVLPLFNMTDSPDERFDNDLSTVYEEITSTVETFRNNMSEGLDCSMICEDIKTNNNILTTSTSLIPLSEAGMNYTARARLRLLCWETMFGQELLKLTVMDLIMTVLSTLAIDFFRGIFVRVMNRCWCWDLEKRFPQYGDFKVAENILHLVNNQGMVWMGMFFSPGLVVLNIIKLYLMMYLRSWSVLTCNVPHEVIFRASRSNNFYYALLLMMLFLCVLPVGYAIVWIKPSWHCGPFSKYNRIFHIFTKTIKNTVPQPVQTALDYIASPGIVIPLLVLLVLIIYYLISLTGALREANSDLKIQLRRERTEERRKMFQLADRRRRGGSGGSNDLANTPFNKWKKILGNMPSGKSFDETPRQESEEMPQFKEEKNENKNKDFFAKLIKKALGKSSTSEDDQNVEDGTDTEQHDSLPEDCATSYRHKPVKSTTSTGSNDFSLLVHRALSLKKSTDKQTPTDVNENKHVKIKDVAPSSIIKRRDTFDIKKNPLRTISQEKPTATRQDSNSSIWSDNIPVITISKTESSENILDEKLPKSTVKYNLSEGADFNSTQESTAKFKPKIKCALKKQSSEIDEDVIFHFGKDIERKLTEENMIRAVAEEELLAEENLPSAPPEETVDFTDKSSSEGTELQENSDDTILNSPYLLGGCSGANGGSSTESSAEYKDEDLNNDKD